MPDVLLWRAMTRGKIKKAGRFVFLALFLALALMLFWRGGADSGFVWREAEERTAGIVMPPPSPAPAPSASPVSTRPKVAIIIDDMGLDRKKSARAVSLPPPVTLSYLAYAPNAQAQADEARARGHEIFLHLPWQSAHEADAGPHVLLAGEAPDVLRQKLKENLDAFRGYVGVNNHMGSLFSQDRAGLDVVMAELKRRGLVFVDSRTSPRTQAESAAHAAGVAAAHRDVFIDDDPSPESVSAQLREVERAARRKGAVIAIGHPKEATLTALESWLPTLAAKGLELVPATAIISPEENKGETP